MAFVSLLGVNFRDSYAKVLRGVFVKALL